MRTAPKNSHKIRRLTGLALAALGPALAWAADAPVPNKGDTAWMMTSTALVLLMSVPALGLFYGGLVRTKNMLSVLMQVFVGFSLITVLWCVYGYSLAFTEGNAFIGGFSRLFLAGTFDPATGAYSHGGDVQQEHADCMSSCTSAFQCTFAAITLLPDPRLDRRAHQILGGAVVPGDLVHLQLPAHRAHGLVLGGPGCLHLG